MISLAFFGVDNSENLRHAMEWCNMISPSICVQVPSLSILKDLLARKKEEDLQAIVQSDTHVAQWLSQLNFIESHGPTAAQVIHRGSYVDHLNMPPLAIAKVNHHIRIEPILKHKKKKMPYPYFNGRLFPLTPPVPSK